MDVDLISVGGGFAGLTAAARAAELGLRVAVVEAGEDDRYWCNSRLANGILHLCYQDVTLPPDALETLLTEWTHEEGRMDHARALAKDAGRVLDWLRQQGVAIVPATTNVGSWYLAPPRPLVTHLEWRGWGPDVALSQLRGRIEAQGGVVLLGRRVAALTMKDGACDGVVVKTAAGSEVISTRAVVIADGGFSGNPDLFRAYIGPRPESVLQRGAGTAVGDGLALAKQAGASTCRLDRFYGHLLSRDAMTNGRLWPYPQLDIIACSGIIVDVDGKRLLDEGLGGIHAANHLATLRDPLCSTAVFGDAIWEGPGRTGGLIPPNPVLEEIGGTLFRSHDIGELAALAGLDPSNLVRTIEAHNEAVDASNPGALMPPRSALRLAPMRIDPPYFAAPLCAAITFTMGGIEVDGKARVLDPSGAPIGGLYAAGNSIGGLEGGPRADYVGGLVKAFVFALRAAEHAASRTVAS